MTLARLVSLCMVIVNLARCVSNTTCAEDKAGPSLQLSFLHDTDHNSSLSIFVTGFDQDGRLKVLHSAGCWAYPEAPSQNIPTPLTDDLQLTLSNIQTSTNFSIDPPLISGRIWVGQDGFRLSMIRGADGLTKVVPPSLTTLANDPDPVTWGFAEFTYDESGGLWANLSYVDFVGLVLKLMLKSTDGTRQYAYGFSDGAVGEICDALVNQTCDDGQPWADLCVYDRDGRPLSILAPNTFISIHQDAFTDYWSSYVEAVWDRYGSEQLWVDTQSPTGAVSCSVKSEDLLCGGEIFSRPSAVDIFSCSSGPFAVDSSSTLLRQAIVARLCAALNRSTLLLGGGNFQPSMNTSSFYIGSPTNFYSKIVHEYELQNVGYAFPYDDVSNNQEDNPANVLVSASAELLSVLIEGY